ncbi:MAG: type II secretion system F family protein [Burkholderiales bacterium]|nr:type II secretion system F family protein [Opitutaceae bacterium]
MPLPHAKLSIVYRQLAQQLSAGLTLAQSLRAPSPAPAGDSFRLAAMAEGGQSVAVVIASAGPWLPTSDRPFLVAAAESGRLPHILANLSERHARIATTQQRVFMACLYPVGVFHFGALVFALIRMIDFSGGGLQGGVAGYFAGLFSILLPVWIAAGLLWYFIKREQPVVLAILDLLPAIGGYRKNQALADFAFALGNLLEAGAPIGRAWLVAGGIARSPRIRRISERIADLIQNGLAPGPHLAGAAGGVFPHEFIARYQTGESTGGLENSLLALAADHQETANRRLVAASMLYPGLLFAAVAVMVAWFVISFYAGYMGQVNQMLDGM